MRRALGHSTPATRRAEPPALARERDQALGLAPDAPESCEPASEPSAREEGLTLLLDKARHALAVAEVRGLGEERLQVLPYHPMQHVRRGVARGVVDRGQGHRGDLGRSRADDGGPSACGVVVTPRFAVAISTYGERAACGISCTRDGARERPKTPALTPHSAGLRPSTATGQRRSIMPPVCSTCTTADTTRSRASSRSVPTTAATRSAWAVKSLAGQSERGTEIGLRKIGEGKSDEDYVTGCKGSHASSSSGRAQSWARAASLTRAQSARGSSSSSKITTSARQFAPGCKGSAAAAH